MTDPRELDGVGARDPGAIVADHVPDWIDQLARAAFISRYIQALSSAQSRLTVAVETSSAAAVSSFVMPPNTRHSNRRLWRLFDFSSSLSSWLIVSKSSSVSSITSSSPCGPTGTPSRPSCR